VEVPIKLMDIKVKNNTTVFLTLLIYASFVLGFYFNENSIGSGGYNGDLAWIWVNFEIYKTNDLWTAIHHSDFFGNRTPLLYILHTILNPYIDNIDSYRFSVFCLSLLGPVIFYLCLKQKFKDVDQISLFFISSFILLSPFYRTTAYWGLEINYGIIAMLISIFFFNSFLEKNKKKQKIPFYLITLLTLFSSLCLYFDQKLLLIPLIIFFKIILSNIKIKLKVFTIINYLIFSIPFLYLIVLWNGIVPASTQLANPDQGTHLSGINLHIFHIGYASSIIAFYLIPIILLKKDNIVSIIKDFFYYNKNIYKILIFIIYLLYIIIFYNFEDVTVNKQWKSAYGVYGLGILHKVSLILFKSIFFREVFTYFSFLVSWIIILLSLEKKIINKIILFYLYFLSLLLFPLMQEYFDPYIFLFSFLLFDFKFNFNFQKKIFAFSYFLIFLASANIYYFIKFS